MAEWVDRTHFKGRLVYFRVRETDVSSAPVLHAASLVRKLAVKPDSPFYGWLEQELARRFDYACCDTLEQFRRERQAITTAGQVKSGGGRHEKDDRHRLDDRSRYVLGWSNEGKIAALEKQAKLLEEKMQAAAKRIGQAQVEHAGVRERLNSLASIGEYRDFQELDWKPLAADIARLEGEKKELEAASDVLKSLTAQLDVLESQITKMEADLMQPSLTGPATRKTGTGAAATGRLPGKRDCLRTKCTWRDLQSWKCFGRRYWANIP